MSSGKDAFTHINGIGDTLGNPLLVIGIKMEVKLLSCQKNFILKHLM